MKIIKLPPKGIFQVNCYMVISDKGNAAVIDAPAGALNAVETAARNGAVITKILLTHGHCDHIEELALLAEKTAAQVYIHKNDESKLYDDYSNLSEYFADYYEEPIVHYHGAETVEDSDIIELDDISFKVIHTPGHTSGSVCYAAGDVMFSGDTLFCMSVGRTDMPDGNQNTLIKSLKRLDEIKENYIIYPGHGSATELLTEQRKNPYMKGLNYDDWF